MEATQAIRTVEASIKPEPSNNWQNFLFFEIGVFIRPSDKLQKKEEANSHFFNVLLTVYGFKFYVLYMR